MRKISFILGIIIFVNCAGTKVLRNPFGLQYSSFASKSNAPKELATELATCEVLFKKRFYNLLYFLPLNKYSNEELEQLSKTNSVRYRNVFRVPDMLITALFGIVFSFTSYTTEVESCSKPQTKLTNAKSTKELKNEFVEMPILARFSNYRENSNLAGAKQFYFIYESKKNSPSKEESQKLDSFLEFYKTNYSSFKILLLMESDEDYKINQERISGFKNILASKGISSGKIYSAFSGNLNLSSQDSKFKNRINILLLD